MSAYASRPISAHASCPMNAHAIATLILMFGNRRMHLSKAEATPTAMADLAAVLRHLGRSTVLY
ncbi:MAG: hypothetical protein AAF151_07215 [Cyanobacteria bacterium J06656_5]